MFRSLDSRQPPRIGTDLTTLGHWVLPKAPRFDRNFSSLQAPGSLLLQCLVLLQSCFLCDTESQCKDLSYTSYLTVYSFLGGCFLSPSNGEYVKDHTGLFLRNQADSDFRDVNIAEVLCFVCLFCFVRIQLYSY